MSDIPRRSGSRTRRLASLPLSYAGRSAVGLGRRIGGQTADDVWGDVQERTAAHLFRTLGELKGGALKFGQMMSILEAAFPEKYAEVYRDQLTKLQDAAPPMPTVTVRRQIAADLGEDWADRLVWLDGGPTAAASIGQVHKGRWHDGRDVAIKVQYPGAEQAVRSDLKQLGFLGRTAGALVPGMDVRSLVAELRERVMEELDYALEAEAQRAFAAAFRDDTEIVIPDVVDGGHHTLVTEWLESPYSLAHVIAHGTQAERDHYGELFVRFLFNGPRRTGMLHSDPHPGNYRILPAPDGGLGRLGVLDFGSVARLGPDGLPEAMGRLIRIAAESRAEDLEAGLRAEGFIRDRTRIDPDDLLAYLGPFVEPGRVERFRFTREWMRLQFKRINDPREPLYTIGLKLNLPPSYLLINRTWLAGVGVLSQLGAEAPFREILSEALPGFAAPDAPRPEA